MDPPGEINSHQRRERGEEGKLGSWKVESLDKLQEKLIKGGKGNVLALDQVLGNFGQFWPTFELRHTGRRRRTLTELRSRISLIFAGYVDTVRGYLGFM
jgi:hypothetical protein